MLYKTLLKLPIHVDKDWYTVIIPHEWVIYMRGGVEFGRLRVGCWDTFLRSQESYTLSGYKELMRGNTSYRI